jgi:hypothetical protein
VPVGALLQVIAGDTPAPSQVAETGNLFPFIAAGTEIANFVVLLEDSLIAAEVEFLIMVRNKTTLSSFKSLDQISDAFEFQDMSK